MNFKDINKIYLKSIVFLITLLLAGCGSDSKDSSDKTKSKTYGFDLMEIEIKTGSDEESKFVTGLPIQSRTVKVSE